MAETARRTRELAGVAPDAIPFDALIEAQQPVILRGLARDWPLVRHASEGAAEAIAYLKHFDGGRLVTGSIKPNSAKAANIGPPISSPT